MVVVLCNICSFVPGLGGSLALHSANVTLFPSDVDVFTSRLLQTAGNTWISERTF